jgi:hypothetical protein
MAHAFEKMIRYMQSRSELVWFATRPEIAGHLLETSPSAEPYRPLG